MNVNVPPFECLLRTEYLYDLGPIPEGEPAFTPVVVFGAASVPGKALGFHVLLENGAQFGRLPVWALVAWENETTLQFPPPGTRVLCDIPDIPGPQIIVTEVKTIDYYQPQQVWDCPSADCECIVYDYLADATVYAYFEKDQFIAAHYRMTFDWWGSSIAEGAGDLGWKCAHLVELDTGAYALLPNNRLRFHLPEWTDKPFPERPAYKTMSRTFSVENRRQP